MKIILNADVKHLGEEGDVKVVANGYARNYLFPRNLAVPYNDMTVAYFESRRAEIEARKEEKRKDAASVKDKLEALVIEIVMPAGANGKLYGVERKRIEIPGLAIKSVGKYHALVRLYETAQAQIQFSVISQQDAEAAAAKAAAESASAESSAQAETPAAAEDSASAE